MKCIKISRPRIEIDEKEASLLADIVHLDGEKTFVLRYTVEPEYARYLCSEVADCFLLAVLPWAVCHGFDISCEAPISSRLLFNVYNTIIPAYQIIHGLSKGICIAATGDSEIKFAGKGVGCGCSLGVDSLAAIWAHLGDEVPAEYRLTHLAVFNCGHLGDRDPVVALQNFKRSAEDARAFAARVKLPLVCVDTNIASFYVGSGVEILESINARTISCAMALQKLFSKYVFASSYYFPQYKFVRDDEEFCEDVTVPAMATNSFQAILSGARMTRVEKERYIDQFELTHEFLNCCGADQWAWLDGGGDSRWLNGKDAKNCGWCDKCLRTLLAYDVMGKLEHYSSIFNLDKYRAHRVAYIRKCFAYENRKPFNGELVNLMLSEKYPVPIYLVIYRELRMKLRCVHAAVVNMPLSIFRFIRKLVSR